MLNSAYSLLSLKNSGDWLDYAVEAQRRLLKQLVLEGFKGLKKAEVDTGRIILPRGPDGTGKSGILQAVAILIRRGGIILLSEFLGFLAGALTTFGFAPQVIRVLKLRSAHEISLPFVLLFISGIICWLIYGIYSGLLPVIVWNALSAILGAILLYAKLRYGR